MTESIIKTDIKAEPVVLPVLPLKNLVALFSIVKECSMANHSVLYQKTGWCRINPRSGFSDSNRRFSLVLEYCGLGRTPLCRFIDRRAP